VHFGRTLEPDPSRHEQYRFWLERYRELYPAIREVQHAVVRGPQDATEAPRV
jgi:sugar (pentulose or hexulose) kinase